MTQLHLWTVQKSWVHSVPGKAEEDIFEASEVLFILFSSLPDCRFIAFNACGYRDFQRSVNYFLFLITA
jgi:hypothetical protein